MPRDLLGGAAGEFVWKAKLARVKHDSRGRNASETCGGKTTTMVRHAPLRIFFRAAERKEPSSEPMDTPFSLSLQFLTCSSFSTLMPMYRPILGLSQCGVWSTALARSSYLLSLSPTQGWGRLLMPRNGLQALGVHLAPMAVFTD
jgi:hypothetical protein